MDNTNKLKLNENNKFTNKIIGKNISTLEDYHNLNLNFKKLIYKHQSIIFKNCSDLNITIQSDINRIEIFSCSNIKLNVKKLIGGIITKKSDIEIFSSNLIYNLETENSIIKLSKDIYNDINYIRNFQSKIFIQ